MAAGSAVIGASALGASCGGLIAQRLVSWSSLDGIVIITSG